MVWLNKNKFPKEQKKDTLRDDVRVEVTVSNQQANKDVANKAKEATQVLNELLEANHFTIKIYRAAGGVPRSQLKTKEK